MPNPLKLLRRLLPRALGAWLALAFVALSIVLTLVLTSLIERKSSEQVETSIGHGLAELAMQTSDKLERGMFERYREVGLLARRPLLGEDQPPARRRAKRGGTARRGKNRRSRAALLKLWPGSAASPATSAAI